MRNPDPLKALYCQLELKKKTFIKPTPPTKKQDFKTRHVDRIINGDFKKLEK